MPRTCDNRLGACIMRTPAGGCLHHADIPCPYASPPPPKSEEPSGSAGYKDDFIVYDLPFYESNATPEQLGKKLRLMGEQVELLSDQHLLGTPVRFVKVRCGCNKMVRLIEAYRCLYCGIFYCKECAEEHFGMRVPPSVAA